MRWDPTNAHLAAEGYDGDFVEASDAPAIISTKDALFWLKGETCETCGDSKRSMMSHCSKCYRKLPRDLQKRLYRKMRDGYEEAYTESRKFLEKLAAKKPVKASDFDPVLF